MVLPYTAEVRRANMRLPDVLTPEASWRTNAAGDAVEERTAVQSGADISRMQAGASAIERNVRDTFRDEVPVFDYIPAALHAAILARTSTTDVASYITAALSEEGKIRLKFPRGRFRVNSAITLADGQFLDGSAGVTELQTGSATADVLILGNVGGQQQNLGFKGFKFTSSVARTAGRFVYVKNVLNWWLCDWWMEAPFIGIEIDAVGGFVERGMIRNIVASTGKGMRLTGGNDQFIRSVIMDCPTADCDAGIEIVASGGSWLSDLDCIRCGDGMRIVPGSGQEVTWMFAADCAFDTGTGDGITIEPGAGGLVKGLDLIGCWSASNDGVGVKITQGSGTIDGVFLTGFRSYANDGHGVEIVSGTNIHIDAASIAGNSASSSGTNSGVKVANSVTDFSIKNSVSGQHAAFGAAQKYGVDIGASCNRYTVALNDLTGNATAGLSDGSALTAALQYVAGNHGADIDGWTTYTPTVGSGTGTITTASAAGRYLRRGKSLDTYIAVTITTNGTGATNVTATAPSGITAKVSDVITGSRTAVAGNAVTARIAAGSGTFVISQYDNTYPGASGEVIIIRGTIEIT